LETAAAAQKIADSLATEKYRCWELEKQLLGITAQNYVNCVNPVHFEASLSGNALRELAEQMSRVCQGFSAVFTGEDSSYRYCLASREQDLRPIGKALTTALNGRGGGKPEAQQGTVCATRKEIEDYFRSLSQVAR
jgi:alanyl-tRNA synthetase